jgi:hypothetical protein
MPCVSRGNPRSRAGSRDPGSAANTITDAPRRILFIGNSLTYAQQGIFTHLTAMAAVATPPLTIQADRAVVGGQYFKTLWERFPEPREQVNLRSLL